MRSEQILGRPHLGAGAAVLSPSARLWSPFASQAVRESLVRGGSGLTLVGLWFLAAAILPPSVMPGPPAVVKALWADMLEGPIWVDVAITLGRIVSAFVIAMALGLMLGFAMGLSRLAESFFNVWITCAITIPSLVTILTIFMIGGLNERSAILGAALPIVPVLAINIWQGIKGVDQRLIDMARVFRADRQRVIRSIIAPQIAPVLIASSRFGLGLIWKMVLFVELLGRSDGVGYKIEFYYQLFNMTEVLAHALLFLLIMLAIEVVILGRIEKRVFRWRPAQRHV